MSRNTIASIIFRNFGNFDLTTVMDKADLENLDIPLQNTEVTAVVTGDSDVNFSVKPKAPDSVTFKILGWKLKELNRSLYKELSEPSASRSLGSAIILSGADTNIFTKVLIEKGLDQKGSYQMHTSVTLKFIK